MGQTKRNKKYVVWWWIARPKPDSGPLQVLPGFIPKVVHEWWTGILTIVLFHNHQKHNIQQTNLELIKQSFSMSYIIHLQTVGSVSKPFANVSQNNPNHSHGLSQTNCGPRLCGLIGGLDDLKWFTARLVCSHLARGEPLKYSPSLFLGNNDKYWYVYVLLYHTS